MKYLIIFFFLLGGCFGEKKAEEKNKGINIQRLIGILTNVEFSKEILVGEGFGITGHFYFNIKNLETGEDEKCEGSIFRKEFPESFFYFYIDCYGNFMFNLLRKKI